MSHCLLNNLIVVLILIPSILTLSEYDQINLAGNENFRANGIQFMSRNSKTPVRLLPIEHFYFLDRNPSSNQFTNNKRNEIGDSSNGNLQTLELMKILNDLRAKTSGKGKEFFVG